MTEHTTIEEITARADAFAAMQDATPWHSKHVEFRILRNCSIVVVFPESEDEEGNTIPESSREIVSGLDYDLLDREYRFMRMGVESARQIQGVLIDDAIYAERAAQ